MPHAQCPGRAAGKGTWTSSEGSLCPRRGPRSQAARPHQLSAHKPQSNLSLPVTSEDAREHSHTAGLGRLRSLPVSTNPVLISKLSKPPKAPCAPNPSPQGPSTPSGPHQLQDEVPAPAWTHELTQGTPLLSLLLLCPRSWASYLETPMPNEANPGPPPRPTWRAPVFPTWPGKHSDAPGAPGGTTG